MINEQNESSVHRDPVALCIVLETKTTQSETFIQAHIDQLPARIGLVHGFIPHLGNRPVLAQNRLAKALRKAKRMVRRKPWEWEVTLGYIKAFQELKAQVVLAEYGTVGARVTEACCLAKLPLVVHFRGYDASIQSVLEEYRDRYTTMFQRAAAIVAVSHSIERRMLALGAPPEKIHYIPSGANCERFEGGADPKNAPPLFLAVGRFVEKKAPHLTLQAFHKVWQTEPRSRLRMIGKGPLLEFCRGMAAELGLQDVVTFLGAQPHEVVRREMLQVRAFVQHSVVAPNGDCEGTPVAVQEAGAMGLPVVATRHAGIPDVVVEGVTGLLVDEGDVPGMAKHMLSLVQNPTLAGEMGQAAKVRIEEYFCMNKSIERLSNVIRACVHSN